MDQAPRHLLCIEPRFPGRLGAVADWLVRCRGYRCQFYCNAADARSQWPESIGHGLEVVQFNVGGVARSVAVPWTRDLERGLCYAFGCGEVLEARRPRPVDLALGRSAGLGSTLLVPPVLGDVPIVNFFDYFYDAHLHDLAGEAGAETPAEYFHWRRAANAMTLLELENGVHPWVPTAWQRDLFPAEYRDDFRVLHDGVDVRPLVRPTAGVRQVAGRSISAGTRVVSFVARTLDGVRGFDRFLRLADRLVQLLPEVLVIVVGGRQVERALDVTFHGQDYAAHLERATPLARPDRFWFLGAAPRATVAEVLTATDLHVYPSRAYPVGRSLVEALAAGAVVLAWDEPPIREFIEHGQTGFLVPPADEPGAVTLAGAILSAPGRRRTVGDAAARLAHARYAQDAALPALAEWFDQLAARRG